MATAKKKAPAKKAAPASDVKSIVDPKYREAYKNREPDWLAKLIAGVAQPLVEKKVTEVDGETKKVKTIKVPGDIDIKALFGLAKENGLDVAVYKSQEGSHGFEGRMRMTIRNMLQGAAKRQHGLNVGGKWTKAPAEWLAEKGAPEAPTHGKDGVKLEKKAAKKAAA